MLALEVVERLAKDNFLLDLESVIFQVHDPAIAAFSGRRLIDRD
jgi:hypothetical protein